MLEESESIRGANRRDRRPKRLDQGLTGTGSGLSQQTLDLRKRLLDRVEVWRIPHYHPRGTGFSTLRKSKKAVAHSPLRVIAVYPACLRASPPLSPGKR